MYIKLKKIVEKNEISNKSTVTTPPPCLTPGRNVKSIWTLNILKSDINSDLR